MSTIPTIGRIVHYTLSEYDAKRINTRRADTRRNISKHMEDADGSQLHAGNDVTFGDVFPAIVVRTWGATAESAVQLHVFLDGNDAFWASSRIHGFGPGQWFWPAETAPVEAMEPPYTEGHGLFQ